MDSFDVLVIGGGVAGTAAALAAARAGRRVGLVRAAPGATALAAGGWAGPLPEPLAYALEAAGLPYARAAGPLPHPCGDLRAFEHAAATHANAAARDGTLVCGVAGLPAFRARSLARLWGAAADASLDGATLELEGTPRNGWSPVALAAAVEREPGPLARAVAAAVRARGAAGVVLPAVLGLERPARVRAEIESAAGVPVGEALGVPPSVPGWRLDRALVRALEAAGVVLVRARVQGRVADGRRLRGVTAAVDSPDRGGPADARLLEAAGFVLATGKFVGGGITSDGELAEPALGCPVWVEHLDGRRHDGSPLALTAPERNRPQPLLEAGVHTDDDGRPLDRWGDVVYENVRVAGTVRAGCEAAGHGLGHAADDGRLAGAAAAEAAA